MPTKIGCSSLFAVGVDWGILKGHVNPPKKNGRRQLYVNGLI